MIEKSDAPFILSDGKLTLMLCVILVIVYYIAFIK